MRHPVRSHEPVSNRPVVYGLKDPRHGRFCYVGQTVDVEKRRFQHLDGRYLHGNLSKALWMEDLKKAGLVPDLTILEKCESFPAANAAEKEWIRKLIADDHPLLNKAAGGTGSRGTSKFNAARKRDWIELGYLIKTGRLATLAAHCELSGILPKSSREVTLLRKAADAIDEAKSMLESRLLERFPEWKNDVTKVFYGAPDEHAAVFKGQCDEGV